MTVQKGAIPKLTLESVRVRAVEVPLRRPIVAKVGVYSSWPMMLIDVTTREGIVGRSYLEPYVKKSIKSIAQLTQDLADLFKDKPLAPLDCYRDAMRVMHLNGREGMTLIAIAGLDMAIWDALAKAANLPLAALLGGTTGKVRAYNTNGLWLVPLEQVPHEAEELVEQGGFKAIKLRLGRATLKEDLATIAAARSAVGERVELMCDFQSGLELRRSAAAAACAGRSGPELVRRADRLRRLRRLRPARARAQDAAPDRRKHLRSA